MISIISFIISFTITTLLIPKIWNLAVNKKLMDLPNTRKVHRVATPRLGGIAFFPSILLATITGCSYLLLFSSDNYERNITDFFLVLAACSIMYVIGIIDDLKNVHYKIKFISQFAAAILIILSGSHINSLYGILHIYTLPDWAGYLFTFLIIILITNAMNLIDGIDGLASGIAIIMILVFGFHFIYAKDTLYILLSFATIGTLLSFFYFNISSGRCKMFMGDAGSLLTGCIISILAVRLCRQDGGESANHFIIAYSLLIVPCFDVIRVFLKRCMEHRPLFLADRSHIHHKCIDMGLSQRQALIGILLLSIAFLLCNMLLQSFFNIQVIIGIDVLLWILLHINMSKQIRLRALTKTNTHE